MTSTGKIVIGTIFIAALGGLGFIGYKKGWFSKKASDMEITNLLNVSAFKGLDVFQGMSFNQAKDRLKKITSKEIQTLIKLFSISENQWSVTDKEQVNKIFYKITGKYISNGG